MLDALPDLSLPAAPAAARPAGMAGLPVVDPAALELALRILQGEMRQIAITADMVGMRLAYEGNLVLIGSTGALPLPVAQAAAAPARTTTGLQGDDKRDTVEQAVLKALETLNDWVANLDLCELLMGEIGRSNVRSANNVIGPSLAALRERGLVETREERTGRGMRKLHRAIKPA